jgi:hypothetical protein
MYVFLLQVNMDKKKKKKGDKREEWREMFRQKDEQEEEFLKQQAERKRQMAEKQEEGYGEEDEEELGLLPAVTYKKATKTKSDFHNIAPPKDSRFASVVAAYDRSLTEKWPLANLEKSHESDGRQDSKSDSDDKHIPTQKQLALLKLVQNATKEYEDSTKYVQPVGKRKDKGKYFLASEVREWIDQARASDKVGSTKMQIVPKNNEVYVVKAGSKRSRLKLISLDPYQWHNNGKNKLGKIGDRQLYYQVNAKENKRTISNFQGEDLYVIHYKFKVDPTKTAEERQEILMKKQEEARANRPLYVPEDSSDDDFIDDDRKKQKGTEKRRTKLRTPNLSLSEDDELDETNDELKDIAEPPKFDKTIVDAVRIQFDETLDYRNAEKITRQAHDQGLINKATETLPADARDGDTYVFDVVKFPNWQPHLNTDNYRWRQYTHTYPSMRFETTKYGTVSDISNCDKRWKKTMIWDKKNQLVTIQYDGDQTIATRRPHGNSKTNRDPYVRCSTAFVKARVKQSEVIGLGPHSVMVNVNTGTTEGHAGMLTLVRNENQVKNILRKQTFSM